MQRKWEYKLLRFNETDDAIEMDEAMNNVGEFEWELVGMMHHPKTEDDPSYYTAVFKRPKH
jgi:hypothetical protein